MELPLLIVGISMCIFVVFLVNKFHYSLVRKLKNNMCCKTILYMLEVVKKWKWEMVLRSFPIKGQLELFTMPLYWRKEGGYGRLGFTLTSPGEM